MHANGIRIPDQLVYRTSIEPLKVAESTLDALLGLAAGIESLGDFTLDKDNARQIAGLLAAPLSRLNKFRRTLEEIAQ